jgi:hypothetical protein
LSGSETHHRESQVAGSVDGFGLRPQPILRATR